MKIEGSGIHDPSVRFRMYAIVFIGVLAFGGLIYWRSELFLATEALDSGPVTVHKERKQKDVTTPKRDTQQELESLNIN